ncbi:MAG TPA: hypothetical protein VFJ15_06455 [Oleiagrimonas sp.]|nr:hypothetical protein [Oleiagrimonas sp.]
MSTTTPPPESHEPDDLLPDEADLRRHYANASRPEPGAELDARVRRMAEQALDETNGEAPDQSPRVARQRGHSRNAGPARGQRGSGRRRPRTWWLAAVGSVAVAVFAVGLVRHQHIVPPAAQAPARADHAPMSSAASMPANSAAGRALSATRRGEPQAGSASSGPNKKMPSAGASPSPIPPLPTAALQAPQPKPKPEPPSFELVAPSAKALRKPAAPSRAPTPPTPSSPVARLSLRAIPGSTLRATSSASTHDARTLAPEQRSTETKTLQHIRDLFAQDKTEQALDLLKAFRKAHPQQQLPADLREKLPEK